MSRNISFVFTEGFDTSVIRSFRHLTQRWNILDIYFREAIEVPSHGFQNGTHRYRLAYKRQLSSVRRRDSHRLRTQDF